MRLAQIVPASAFLAWVMLFLTARQSEAQSTWCKYDCKPAFQCGHAFWQGYNPSPCPACHYESWENCCYQGCCGCTFDAQGGDDGAARLAAELDRLHGEAFIRLLEQEASRLLFDPGRMLLIVLGGCDGSTPERVVFLTDDQTTAVSLANGLQRLDAYVLAREGRT